MVWKTVQPPCSIESIGQTLPAAGATEAAGELELAVMADREPVEFDDSELVVEMATEPMLSSSQPRGSYAA